MKKLSKNWRGWVPTVIAIVVAVAMDWQTIDWLNFKLSKEWPKLLLSAIIAIGGVLSRISIGKGGSNEQS